MSSTRFLRFAYRIAAYDGMLARRLEAQRDREKAATPAPPPSTSAPTGGRSQSRSTARPAASAKHLAGATVVPVAAMGVAFQGLFEHTRAPSPTAEGAASPTES